MRVFTVTKLLLPALLGACQSSEKAQVQIRFEKTESRLAKLASRDMKLASTSTFQSDYCYFVNVSAADGSACASGASSLLGKVSGITAKGGQIQVEATAGKTARFDLLAFPKAGGCSGAFSVEDKGSGRFVAKVDGQAIEPVWLVGTKTHAVTSGTQVVTMAILGDSAAEMGVSLACDESKKPVVGSVSMIGTDQLKISGTQLDQVTRVSLTNLGTTFQIVSKTATEVIAKVSAATSLTLGQSYNLLVANAYGQTSATLSVQLSNGSVRAEHLSNGAVQPQHLDMSLDWPFPTPKSVIRLSAVDGQTTSTNLDAMSDGELSTYTVLSSPSTGTCGSNPAGQYVFQIGDGTKVYAGDIEIRFSTVGSGSMPTASINFASSVAELSSNPSSYVGLGSSSSIIWAKGSFTGSYFVLSASCNYYGDTNLYQIYEIRINAKVF